VNAYSSTGFKFKYETLEVRDKLVLAELRAALVTTFAVCGRTATAVLAEETSGE